MDNQIHLPIALFFILCLLSSCVNHNEEDLYGLNQEICDTSSVSFSRDIQPILQQSCMECHSTLNAPLISGVDLEDFSVLSSLARGGVLLGAIRQDEGFVPMPDQNPKLDTCAINKFTKWIQDGAENN